MTKAGSTPAGKPMTELKGLMAMRKWTQAEAARRLKVSPATICRWLKGTVRPNRPTETLIHIFLEESKRMAGI